MEDLKQRTLWTDNMIEGTIESISLELKPDYYGWIDLIAIKQPGLYHHIGQLFDRVIMARKFYIDGQQKWEFFLEAVWSWAGECLVVNERLG